MSRIEIGSYESFVHQNDDLLALIFEDIRKVMGVSVTTGTLRHVTIISDNDNLFRINGFNFRIRDGIFSTPSNGSANLMVIRSFVALQDCHVQINYIR